MGAGEMKQLRRDPLPLLLGCGNAAVRYLAQRDLLGQSSLPLTSLWEFPEVLRVIARQQGDGRWKYPGGKPAVRSAANYDQLETYRQLAVLVCKYGLDRHHPAVAGAARFLSSFQTGAGDYRGIYGRQYTPNYSAAITELLIRAGYKSSGQVEKTMRWLLSMRQNDGGWAIPARTRGIPLKAMLTASDIVEPDRSRPSSHLVTGIVLRAMAAHGRYRDSPATYQAGKLLKSRFFLRDSYPDRAAPSYWTVFSYPYWWTDLLSALDSLTQAGFQASDPDIARGTAWFIDNQEGNGLWNAGHNRPKDPHSDLWVGLAICRMLNAAWTDGKTPGGSEVYK
jgi:Squalene-hopene cyclase C-terminal domain